MVPTQVHFLRGSSREARVRVPDFFLVGKPSPNKGTFKGDLEGEPFPKEELEKRIQRTDGNIGSLFLGYGKKLQKSERPKPACNSLWGGPKTSMLTQLATGVTQLSPPVERLE